ncbi:MAG: hypothetical protein RI947_453 [Candidatus Parcubacteria bacterium]|jgi:hypothetical protein
MLVYQSAIVNMNEHTAHRIGLALGLLMVVIFTILTCYSLIPGIYGINYNDFTRSARPVEVNLVRDK